MSFLKKRRKSSIKVKGLIILLLLVVALCIYTFYLLAPLHKKKLAYPPAPPAKKTPELKLPDYSYYCHQINQKTILFFERTGCSRKNIHLLKESPQKSKTKKWVYTEIEIYLPQNINLINISENLAKELKVFSPLKSKWETTEPNKVLFLICLNGVLSHSIILLHLPPQLAIIIDDLGENLALAKKFLALGIPLTFSILPNQTHSRTIEELAHN
ncbi:MAG: divergent polysaccharide deacetylase family protein, partial [Desulfobacterota bacterium]|nr:divergent polysaccharide deacetylase family protein [Thermodesulfobacteriota bacterium]